MTTKAIFRKDALSKKGEASVLIRITVNRLKAYINLGVRINKKQWNSNTSQIKKSHPNYKLINARIIRTLSKIQETAMKLDIRGKNYTAKSLKEIVENKHEICIMKFGKAWYEERYNKHEISIGTYKARIACLNKLQEFAKGLLSFDDLDYEHLLRYDSFLITKLGNNRNTANTNLKCIQAIYNETIKRDIASYDNNPFKK